MVEIGLAVGIFSYVVFGLGILGLTNQPLIGGVSLFFVIFLLGLLVKIEFFKKTANFFKEIQGNRLSIIFFGLLVAVGLINLLGALGPELGFDALWYHLTIPKIYLSFKKIFFIPGGLFYYSAMPKLTEMLYFVSLNFFPSGILAKTIHFSFGVLCAAALYSLSRRYLTNQLSLLVVLIFYSTLIVGWQSITAYVDLARTFYEILALGYFLSWGERKENKYLAYSAVMLGLAVATKLIAFASLPIFLILIFFKSRKTLFAIRYSLFAIFIASPWLLFSWVYTGNPFFPAFSNILDFQHKIVSPHLFRFFTDLGNLFFRPQDPISPVFLIFLPIILWGFFKKKKIWVDKILVGYLSLAYIFWYLTPRTGGSRFILPYLPALSLFLVLTVSRQEKFFQKALIVLSLIIAVINLGYRMIANSKFLPVIVGKQTKEDFLSKNLDFNFGDFYDLGGELKKIIKKEDLVLVYGSHNLFYTDFPFIHESFAKPGTYFSYVLTQDTSLPEKLGNLKQIYQNPVSKVNLYVFGKPLP